MNEPIRIGDIELSFVSGGRLRIDGGNMFGVIPRAMWARVTPPDDQNRIELETNCVIVRTQDSLGLIDTGYGGKLGAKIRQRHALEDGAPLVQNLAAIGIAPDKVDWVILTHLHYDHAGGIAELQRRTGATVMAMPGAYLALETGEPDKHDPQFDLRQSFAGSKVGIMLSDGFVVRQGPLKLTAFATPGHAPGSTTWSWRSCEEKKCVNMVYADSVTAVSADSYRFSDHRAYLAAFKSSLGTIRRSSRTDDPSDARLLANADFSPAVSFAAREGSCPRPSQRNSHCRWSLDGPGSCSASGRDRMDPPRPAASMPGSGRSASLASRSPTDFRLASVTSTSPRRATPSSG